MKKLLDGEYRFTISLATEIGEKQGTLTVTVRESRIRGTMEILDQKQPCIGNVWRDGSCVLIGKLKNLRSDFAYAAEGMLDEETIALNLKYSGGAFRLTGECANRADINRKKKSL